MSARQPYHDPSSCLLHIQQLSVRVSQGFEERAGKARQRERVCRSAGWLGIALDGAANLWHGPRISTRESPVSAWVIPTNEELMIARHTMALIASQAAAGVGA